MERLTELRVRLHAVKESHKTEERLADLKARLDAVKESHETVPCMYCHKQVFAITAHTTDGGYVGDECCWDERLRSSE